MEKNNRTFVPKFRPNREGTIVSSKSNAKVSRPLTSQSNDQLLLQTVRIGFHGLNLQKIHQNCKLPEQVD